MATEVIMPKAGMAMERGTVIQWYKKPGDYVNAGEPLLEIETDKVAMEVEAEVSGYLLSILHDAGDEVDVIKTIGYIGEKDETPPVSFENATAPDRSTPTPKLASTPSAPTEPATGSAHTGPVKATPAARRIAGEKGIELASVPPSGQWGEVRVRDIETAAGSAAGSQEPRISPLARKMAEERGVDPAAVRGSGPGGRILKRDVGGAAEQTTPLKGIRKVIAERMAASHQTIPPVTLNRKVVVSQLLAMREEINEGSDVRVSLTDLLVVATARALRDAPYMRTTVRDGNLVTFTDINIGIAVALEDGLVVPVIRNADSATLSEVARSRIDLATRSREGKLTPDDLHGATFTITNLGMFGITSFTPIIDLPQAAILGVNTVEDELYIDGDSIESRKVMTLSLTIDHRVIDGAQGAIFLNSFSALIEKPVRILV